MGDTRTVAPNHASARISRMRALEARACSPAVVGCRERAIWLDVARLWDAAAESPELRPRADELDREASLWLN